MMNAKNEFQKLHISRKIEHSKRVNKLSLEIAQKLNLDDEEVYLINITSLLHDIGRFKQFYDYNTYMDEISCNHAKLGIDILKENKVLDDLDNRQKETVIEIIKLHNYKQIPNDMSKQIKLYASIIMEADKIDWIYAMINIIPNLEEKDQAVFYSNKQNKNYISDKIVNLILSNETITKNDVETIDELRISVLGWLLLNIKNKPSYEIIKRENLIKKSFDLIYDSKEKNNHL